jgi:AraC family transcriptional regulator of adaptative response/methylated-DNA-[protein]-cysteine methyltransferase
MTADRAKCQTLFPAQKVSDTFEGVSREAWARLTAFQRRVYRAICRIPPGETRSYQWVARAIGHPRSARAVGQALKRNPFAPRVPCHRVVRSDGALGGYSGGLAKKRRLLEQEHYAKVDDARRS